MLDTDIYGDIARECGCALALTDARSLTTFKGGGRAYVFKPRCESEFIFVYAALKNRGYEPYILGGGSNTIMADGLCSVPVVSTCGLCGIETTADLKIYAESGAKISDVISALRGNGLGGLEFLSGVPATVGGAVKMNAGAFSKQTADYIDRIRVLSDVSVNNSDECLGKDLKTEYRAVEIAADDIVLKYRKGADGIILGAVFNGDASGADKSISLAKKYCAMRAKKQPKFPSCGSVFKNGIAPSGKLIEECGLKGIRSGGAQISEIHANFIVNTGSATAEDFMTLVRLCESKVQKKFGITLEREFVYLQ